MKRKIFSILFALVLVCSFSLVAAVPAGAQVGEVWVDDIGSDTDPGTQADPYKTIQKGVDAVEPGGIVHVMDGEYPEQVLIGKSLTLQGVGDTTIIQPPAAPLTATSNIPWIGSGTGAMSAIVEVETTGGTVIIKNLKIDGSLIPSKATLWIGGLVYLETSGKVEGVTVIGNPTMPDRTAGIFAAALTNSASLEVTGCTVQVYTRAGIYALGGTMTADYHHNKISGPVQTSAGVPNGIFFLRGATGSATYNTITDLAYIGGEYRSTGIGTYNAGVNIVFSHNEISNVQNAFALAVNTSGTVVEYNNVYDCHTGVRIEAAATNSIIQYNDIHDNDFAMRCGPEMGDGNVAHNNNFVGNPGLQWTNVGEGCTYEGAVCNLSVTYLLNAINNWWGTTVESEIQGMVSDFVDYAPWLSTSAWTGTSVGVRGYMPQIVAISVGPSSIDFGTLYPGDSSDPTQLTISNVGTVVVDVATLILDAEGDTAGPGDFFYDNLKLAGDPAFDYSYTPLTVGAPGVIAGVHVFVPPDYPAVGTVTGTLIFEATATTP